MSYRAAHKVKNNLNLTFKERREFCKNVEMLGIDLGSTRVKFSALTFTPSNLMDSYRFWYYIWVHVYLNSAKTVRDVGKKVSDSDSTINFE